jgi:DNA-binding MurR/RpiR family transcriptional regulator
MSNRLATLLTRGNALTRAEYRVLSYLTEHPLLIGNITVRQLAKATFRLYRYHYAFVSETGFSGYSEFIWHCKQLLSETPHIAPQTQPPRICPVFFNQFIANYQQTFHWVTADKRDGLLAAARKGVFFLYGAGFSYLLRNI